MRLNLEGNELYPTGRTPVQQESNQPRMTRIKRICKSSRWYSYHLCYQRHPWLLLVVVMLKLAAVFFDAVGTLLFPEPSFHDVYAEVSVRLGGCQSSEVIRRRFAESFARQEAI